jgi:anti-sigma factor RsiW
MEGRILSYIDGRLKESERQDVEKHLAACATCQLRVEEFRAVSGLLDELPVIEPSPAFNARVHALVAAEPPRKPSFWAWLNVSPRVAFATSALLVAGLWIGLSHHGQPPLPFGGNSQVADEQMMQDLPVLEDHDVISNFEPLKELPPPVQAEPSSDTEPM